ncbi:hypothetical protein HLB42_09705 [Deinococcus sp. D7000]|nr:hypothetical protein HLB42_09705 [Deinococcus sp. D7000]
MTDLPTRLQTHIRHRQARGASQGELALLRELAAELPQPERAFDFPALLCELYPDSFTLAARRANQAFADMAEAIGECSIKETA